MKLDSSTLFVNTGRKPLPAMQKKKKSNKNTVALIVCIAIIAVLCVFVGLILHVWFNYNEEIAPRNTTQVIAPEKEKDAAVAEKPKTEKPKEEEKPRSTNKIQGEKTKLSSAAEEAFASLRGTYSFGIANLNDGYTYINNTDKVENSAALGAFLMEYASHAIYMGTFDYSTDVAGHAGRDLMTRAFSEGSVEAANLLIQHFGTDRLNAYFAEKGYENTRFGGTIGNGADCYTTSGDLIKLMQKMYNNTGFFPYSDMYKKMTVSTVDGKIAAILPEGVSVANIGFDTEEETFDAAIVYTPSGNFIFVAMAEGDADTVASAGAAMSKAAADICAAVSETSDVSE